MRKLIFAGLSLFLSSAALADFDIPLTFATGPDAGKPAGIVHVSETPYGLLFTPDLHDFTPGIHGFHVHENPSCAQEAMAAGGHLDPAKTNKHLGPYNNQGHLGDLPALTVTADGKATLPVVAPRLKSLGTIKNHSLMVHEGGDNYSDTPKLGGGGSRMACGVIPS